MPELVMTSWLRRALLACVIGSAALSGSARPVEQPGQIVRTPEAPALIFPEGHPPRLSDPLFLIG